MPAAYSTDIRGRVIASVESGSSRREAAEEFDVKSELRDQIGLRFPERLEAGRPSRGAGAPHHWRSTRTFC